MAELAVALAALYILVTAIRILFAVLRLRHAHADGRDACRPSDDAVSVSVLQAIRSGDPLMPGLLRENRANHPDARFVWLVDEDDPVGRNAAEDAATGPGALVDVVVTPVLPAGLNPKVFKLSWGLPRCGEVLAVLDDDTVLPPGALGEAVAALSSGDLVTGIPVYREQGSVWSRLVAAFVNGNSLLTYLPVSRLRESVTINGMFYLTRRATLESLGGFAAIEDRLCDDYEIAKLYRSAGRVIVQSAVVHPLATTVPGPGGYIRIMRRWMVFARQVLNTDLSIAIVALVVLPSLLPLCACVTAVASGSWRAGAVVAAAVVLKAAATASLRHRVPAAPASLLGVVAEVVADVVLPLHVLAAAVRPRRVTWRGRSFEAGGDGILVQGGVR